MYDAHTFHYAVEGGLVFMCMADGDFGRRLPFAFIDDIVRRWTETYNVTPNPNPNPNPYPTLTLTLTLPYPNPTTLP